MWLLRISTPQESELIRQYDLPFRCTHTTSLTTNSSLIVPISIIKEEEEEEWTRSEWRTLWPVFFRLKYNERERWSTIQINKSCALFRFLIYDELSAGDSLWSNKKIKKEKDSDKHKHTIAPIWRPIASNPVCVFQFFVSLFLFTNTMHSGFMFQSSSGRKTVPDYSKQTCKV